MTRRSRPMTYVTDMTHLVELSDPDVPCPAPARRLADYLGDIVTAGSLAPAEVPVDTGIPCKRRPGRRPCPGTVAVMRLATPSNIEWSCLGCGESGVISNWEGTPWDASELRADDEPPIAPDGGYYH